VQYLSRAGKVLRPVALFQNGVGFSTGPADAPVVKLAQSLLAAGYDFDHLNAHALLAARVANRRLITSGGATYDQLVMGDVQQLDAEVVERLAQFSDAGLPILLVGKRPTLEAGYLDHQARTARIRLLVDAMIAKPAGVRTAATAPDAVDALNGDGDAEPSVCRIDCGDQLYPDPDRPARRLFRPQRISRRAGDRRNVPKRSRASRAVGPMDRLDVTDCAHRGGTSRFNAQPAGGSLRVDARDVRPRP